MTLPSFQRKMCKDSALGFSREIEHLEFKYTYPWGPALPAPCLPKAQLWGCLGNAHHRALSGNMHGKESQNKGCHRFREGACGLVVELSTSVTDVYITSQVGKVP